MAGSLSREGLAAALIGRWRTASIVLRRGATTLEAQSGRVRIETAAPQQPASEAGREARLQATLWGAPTMDVQPEDRFTLDGVLYRVRAVRPGRGAATFADLEVVS